jgi:hypothetical protein
METPCFFNHCTYPNPSLNPSLPEDYILTFPNLNPNPTRIEVIKLDRTGKYVLKLPHASRNKDRKLDQNKKNKQQPKFGRKSRKQRSPKHFWKDGKQEMEKLIKFVKEIGFFDKK